jgi:hypothetical protein
VIAKSFGPSSIRAFVASGLPPIARVEPLPAGVIRNDAAVTVPEALIVVLAAGLNCPLLPAVSDASPVASVTVVIVAPELELAMETIPVAAVYVAQFVPNPSVTIANPTV